MEADFCSLKGTDYLSSVVWKNVVAPNSFILCFIWQSAYRILYVLRVLKPAAELCLPVLAMLSMIKLF
jgi:hypothetical protein